MRNMNVHHTKVAHLSKDIRAPFYAEERQRMSKNVELIILHVEPPRVILKKAVGMHA